MQIAGTDPDYHRRDLFEAIVNKDYPAWQVQIQIMPEKAALTYPIPAFDLTKVWPHKDYPLIDVGVIELHRNPENYFAEVEQAAFEPGNLPLGMGASPDRVLQARLLSYADAHRYRIGVNYAALPINKPQCPMHTYHRDGHMRFDGNGGAQVNYQPNSFNGPIDNLLFQEPPLKVTGDIDRYDHQKGNDNYTQAGNLYRLINDSQKTQLIDNIVSSMKNIPKTIQIRQIAHFSMADKDYGDRVAKALG